MWDRKSGWILCAECVVFFWKISLRVRNCGWVFCAVCEEMWLDVVCCASGSVAGNCVLWVRKYG